MNQLFFIAIEDYTFILYPLGTPFSRTSGIYAFFILPSCYEHSEAHHPGFRLLSVAEAVEVCHPEPVKGPCHLLYIGITNNFHARFKQHHKMSAAIELGLTHIGILKVSSGRKRKKIERQLLQSCNPPLNQTWLRDNLCESSPQHLKFIV